MPQQPEVQASSPPQARPRWQVEQPTPAPLTWTTPAGRRYTTEPTRYLI